MINKGAGLISILMMVGCSSQPLDLATIDFDQPADKYLKGVSYTTKTDQKGHWIVKHNGDDVALALKDDGEKVVDYVFMDESNTKQLTYSGMKINALIGVDIVTYNDKVSYERIRIINTQTSELASYLKQKLGEPTEIISDETMDIGTKDILFKSFPKNVKETKDEFGNNVIDYPQNTFWIKGELIYQLTLEPVNNVVNNTLNIISKKAFRDKIIVGYHNPDKHPILSKYLN
ncbi:hypothetical protein QEG73_23085 [Chitinophagaceae bacterium 26-R-25]|nr:hypothetical protein [Chitinophagaceae bacterium 26-R-25]